MIKIYKLEGLEPIFKFKGIFSHGILKINNKEIKMTENEIKQKFSRGYWRYSEV